MRKVYCWFDSAIRHIRFDYLPPWLLIAFFLLLVWFWLTSRPDIDSFRSAKIWLENDVFFDHPVTLYCGAAYDGDKRIEMPAGVHLLRHSRRAEKMEWEHVVPVESFGRNFEEWRKGHPDCVSGQLKFYGRKCVGQVNEEFRRIEADMYNLYPAVGSINALRGHRQYASLPDAREQEGICGAKIRGGKFEPPDRAKGAVARASLYMAEKYDKVRLSAGQRKLFAAWDKAYPVDKWECLRGRRIEKLQGNVNKYIREPCRQAGMW